MTKWNKKAIKAAVPEIAKQAGIRDFDGNTADDFVAWMKKADEAGVRIVGLETEAEQRAAFKTVEITFDSTQDDVVARDLAAEQTEEMDDDESEAKAEGDPDEEETKAYRERRKAFRESGKGSPIPHVTKMTGQGGRFGDRRSAVLKSYDRAVKDGAILARTGKTPLFMDGERMEAFNACVRFVAANGKSYPMRRDDERVATKTGLVGQNSTGGALVFGEYFPELIENFNEFGAGRAAVGVEPMAEGVKTVSKMDSDITVYDVGEGDAITASDPSFSNVQLVAKKTAALGRITSEQMNDAAFSMGDIYARSMLRKMREFEDDSLFNSANNRQGFSSLVGANSTFDAALSSDWSDYTISDIQDWLGTLPAWAREDPKFGIACSWQFYMRVLRRFALSAGGNTGQAVLGGVSGAGNGNVWDWDGIPVYITNKLPTTYSANQKVAYAGAFSYAVKIGVVTGSETIASSDQRYFDEDEYAIRMTQRWAINCHDVNNKTLANGGSGIVALQD